MRCQKARSFLSAYCKNELGSSLSSAIAEHLSTCHQCQKEESYYVNIIDASRLLPELKVSGDFNNRLLNRIVKERFQETKNKAYLPKRPPLFSFTRAVPVMAAACLILVAGYFTVLDKEIVTAEENYSSFENSLDDSYLTAKPRYSRVNQTTSLHKDWSFDEELAKVSRVNRISNLLTNNGSGYFSSGNTHLASNNSRLYLPYATSYYRMKPVLKIYIKTEKLQIREDAVEY